MLTDIDFYYDFDGLNNGTLSIGSYEELILMTFQSAVLTSQSAKPFPARCQEKGPVTDYVDWAPLKGWSVQAHLMHYDTWFAMLADQVAARVAGSTTYSGDTITNVAVSEQSTTSQLVNKFLLMGVAFSQAADDYADPSTAGKGLMVSDLQTDGVYSALGHAWDEGFGYSVLLVIIICTLMHRSKQESNNSDNSGVRVQREKNWGNSVNAAKRDVGANVATDYTADAWAGFIRGRTLIANNAGAELTDQQMVELVCYRDQALNAWEKAVAATVVHYINDTLQDMGKFGTGDYSFDTRQALG